MERTLDPVTLEPAVGKTNMLVRADVADREDRSLMAIERDRLVLPFGGDWLAVDNFGSVRNAGPIAHHSSSMQVRSDEHTSELQSLMRISDAVFCLKKKK